ncbi:alpha/beta fold hydrolase [Nocardiopsis sp. NPDC101807]|uniref:alpha/beta fold hydrolase n=1 Tax=Nocardiopsis sp. NPDC101807 TaxID=3364339 RepID=UPI0038158479
MGSNSKSGTSADSAVVSADGTRIAFERLGEGRPVVLVSSALADRGDTRRLARLLAQRFTVVNYDRRGRGASGDAKPYAVEREIEDIAALIAHVGGSASVFGSSSGAVLALRAAVAGAGVGRLALYEPPFSVEPGGFGPPADLPARIDALLSEGRRSDAVREFMTGAQGMPGFMVGLMRLMPKEWANLTAMAHTLPYDIAVMGDTQRGKPLDADAWSTDARTLVLTGGRSPAGFHRAAEGLAGVLGSAEHRVLPGLNHGSVMTAPKRLAPALAEFFGGR